MKRLGAYRDFLSSKQAGNERLISIMNVKSFDSARQLANLSDCCRAVVLGCEDVPGVVRECRRVRVPAAIDPTARQLRGTIRAANDGQLYVISIVVLECGRSCGVLYRDASEPVETFDDRCRVRNSKWTVVVGQSSAGRLNRRLLTISVARMPVASNRPMAAAGNVTAVDDIARIQKRACEFR